MKITLEVILNSVVPYRELQTLKFSPRTSLSIYKLGKELDRELQTYRDLSKEIYEKYSVPETEGGYDVRALGEDKQKEVFADLEELVKSEVDIKDVQIPIEELERSNNDVSPNTIGALEWMIKVPEEEIKQGEPKPKKEKEKAKAKASE